MRLVHNTLTPNTRRGSSIPCIALTSRLQQIWPRDAKPRAYMHGSAGAMYGVRAECRSSVLCTNARRSRRRSSSLLATR